MNKLSLLSVLFFTSVTGCATDSSLEQSTARLDQDNDGFCDSNYMPPLPNMDPERAALASAQVTITPQLASGIEAPTRPSFALVAHYYSLVPGEDEVIVLETGVLDLSAELTLSLTEPPAALLALRERNYQDWESSDPFLTVEELPESMFIVFFDDKNDDGKLGIGDEYFGEIDANSSLEEHVAYFEAREAFYEEYGHLSFFQLSSPVDASNEVIALSPLRIRYGLDSAGQTGWSLFNKTEEECTFEERSGEGFTESCIACTSSTEDASFETAHTLAIEWALP